MAATQIYSVAKARPNPFAKNSDAERASRVFRSGQDRHGREVFSNHVWESLNAAAKILFFAVATPMMLAVWGPTGFGVFAVGNSCVALMVIVDLGLRLLTRVGLTNQQLSSDARIRLHATNFAAFTAAAGVSVVAVVVLALTGCWHRWLHLPPSGDIVIAATATIAAITMALQLLLETIAAAGRISLIKAALFCGNILAFVIVIVLLKNGVTVFGITTAYFTALSLPLLLLLPVAHIQWRDFVRALVSVRHQEIFRAFKSGGWLNLITAAWLLQSYGLIFLIAWRMGPSAAGTFFLFLKLAELLGVLGASASEPTIAALAGALNPQDRHRHFATSYRSAIALCLTGAVVYTFFTGHLFHIWLHRSAEHSYTGLLIALFGISIGFTRLVTAASVGLGTARSAAIGLTIGAIALIVAVMTFGAANLEMILAVGCAAAFFLVPAAIVIARELQSDFAGNWLRPIATFTPSLVGIIAICWAAAKSTNPFWWTIALGVSGIICGAHIFVPSMRDKRGAPKISRLGYDTRSWRSALVMKGIDLLNPFRRPEKFVWNGPCVVSSVAGLGDLFIHLPLISGIVNACRERGLTIHVALRSEHAEIGRRCGWGVIAFDNGLEHFFKKSGPIKLGEIIAGVRGARKKAHALWIDLTGNAVGAAVIKAGGAKKLAARITRGGKSLVDHPLPHQAQENEYANRQRVADFLNCDVDLALAERIPLNQPRDLRDYVVLCVTTASRWKNWPLANFRSLTERFPQTHFVLVGLRREIAIEELDDFEKLRQQPNVIDRIDQLTVEQLVDVIAHSRAVITNDTSAAHIANFFGIPGAVLFGPVSPQAFAAPNGLRIFHDKTCPFHPCVQWSCANQENWCMRKIDIDSVANHLASVLALTPLVQAANASGVWEIPAVESSSAVH